MFVRDRRGKLARYVLGNALLSSTGLAAKQSWGLTNLFTIAPGGYSAFQAVSFLPTLLAANSPPTIGRCVVDSIDGAYYLSTPNAGGLGVMWGAYISTYDSRIPAWEQLSPSVPADLCDDRWLFLRTKYLTVPSSLTQVFILECKLALPHPIELSMGQALHLVIGSDANSSVSFTVIPYFRSLLSDVV